MAVISYPALNAPRLEQHQVWGLLLLVSFLHGPGKLSLTIGSANGSLGLRAEVSRRESSCRGKIISISCVCDTLLSIGRASYLTAQGGMRMLTTALAQELAAYKVRVNAIVPGVIKTSCERWIGPQQEARLLERIPYGRLGEPRGIARAVLWLASDVSDYVTGETVYVHGGIHLQSGRSRLTRATLGATRHCV